MSFVSATSQDAFNGMGANTEQGDATASTSTSTSTPGPGAACQAFHPIEDQNLVTLLSFKVPPRVIAPSSEEFELDDSGKKILMKAKLKEAFFDICLDISGSMAGSGINCAKQAMKRLINHLIQNCGVPPQRITVYLFSDICMVRQMGQPDDELWLSRINASGGTSFATVFKELINQNNARILESPEGTDVDATLFFLTDGADGDPRNLGQAKTRLEMTLKNTPRLDSTVHTFGFTGQHDAKLLSWLTSTGTNSGCFQYVRESSEIESSMSTTLELLGDSPMMSYRKIEILLAGEANATETAQDWIAVKLGSDGVSGSTVVREKPFTGNFIKWREYLPSQSDSSTSSPSEGLQEMRVEWLHEDSALRVLRMTTFIQHELLRLVEAINAIGSDGSASAVQKRAKLLEIDAETEAYSKALGTMAFSAARMKNLLARGPCMEACQRTRSVLQSFLTVKADAHKRGGSISNTSLATFNALAYGQITEAKLKAKLDARAGKNTALFADLDDKVSKIVAEMDLETMEAEESEDKLRELSCAFSTNSYVDALRDGDCLCMTLDVSRSTSAIADPSQLVIKSIFPTYLSSSMFTTALSHSLSNNSPEDVHGGFDRNSDASIAPGLAHENITAVMPLYINEQHWQVAKLRMKPILGYVVTLDATGYTYSQSTTVPFLILAKALESYPMTEFKQRQVQLILETCDAIYRNSKSLRETTKTMVQQYCASHTQRTVDIVTNNHVFLGHVICALRAGDISASEMEVLMPKFEAAMVEEQIRRDMSWRVSEDLMGSVMEWFEIDRQRDIVIPGRQYRERHDAYTEALNRQGASAGVEAHYRALFRQARTEQGVPVSSSSSTAKTASVPSPTTVTTSLSISNAPAAQVIVKPEFKVPSFDPLAWKLSDAALDQLSLIQNAISTGVNKILRLLAVVQSPLDNDLSQVLSSRLGANAPSNLSDEFFAKYSPKINLATLLQAYAHTKNSDRRSVENLMSPFERPLVEGADSASDEALQFLKSLYEAKMSHMINEIVVAIDEEYMDLKKDAAASVFLRTQDMKVAAGVLLESKFRGAAGGVLVTLCARSKMTLPRFKLQMMLTGTYKGVRLFSDKSGSVEDIRWFPCKQTLYYMFMNYHDKFTLDEWRDFHPDRYKDYIACRYVIDGYLTELPEDKMEEVKAIYNSVKGQRAVAS